MINGVVSYMGVHSHDFRAWGPSHLSVLGQRNCFGVQPPGTSWGPHQVSSMNSNKIPMTSDSMFAMRCLIPPLPRASASPSGRVNIADGF